jgi:hypothetical protein
MPNQDSPSGLEDALEKSEAVEGKVQDASDKLSVVKDRTLIYKWTTLPTLRPN